MKLFVFVNQRLSSPSKPHFEGTKRNIILLEMKVNVIEDKLNVNISDLRDK